jgi:hypothetical protein
MIEGYYNSTRRKIADFLIGFFGISGTVTAIAILLSSAGRGGSAIEIAVFLEVGALILCFAMGRRFMGWGMLAALLMPALFIGACFLSLS